MEYRSHDDTVTDIYGLAIKTPDGSELTRRAACISALLNAPSNGVPGEERFARYELAMKIKVAGEELELSIEEVAKLKKLIGVAWGPVVVGPMWLWLDRKLF